jgi:hypothetical protein
MKRIRKFGWRELIVLLIALACAGTLAADQVRSMRDRSKVAEMTKKMKTICVGRFLIDVPDEAVVGLSHETLDGFAIAAREESDLAFRERIAAREIEIQAEADARGHSEEGMETARDLHIPGMVGRVIVYGHTRTHNSVEGERRIDEEWVAIEAHAHTAGLSFSLSRNYADKEVTTQAEVLLARLRLRDEDEIPAVPGFCIWRAVFVEPTVPKAGSIVMSLGLPGHPDLAMHFISLPGGGSDPDLLARAAHTDATAGMLESLLVTTPRAAKRNVNGLASEEVLERARELNLARTYGFMWETRGLADDPLQPFLSFELQAGVSRRPGGKPAGASLHEDALLALWDSILASIRRHRAQLVATTPREPVLASLGQKLKEYNPSRAHISYAASSDYSSVDALPNGPCAESDCHVGDKCSADGQGVDSSGSIPLSTQQLNAKLIQNLP